MIYLDNAATTYPKPEEVYKSMDYANRELAVNAGRGLYNKANQATKIIDETKSALLKLVKGDSSSAITFAPSITIALNQILNGLDFKNGDIVYVSPFEHNAVMRTLSLINKKMDINIKELPLNKDSFEIDLDKTKYLLAKDKPKCVCVNYISNVTGYILPVKEILEESKKNNAITVLDAAQAFGLIDIDISCLSADFIAFTGHKSLYGPFGIAGFISNSKITLNDFIAGGTGTNSLNLDMPNDGPNRYESASPNIVAISGLKAALEWIDLDSINMKEKKLTDYLIEELSSISGLELYLPENLDNHIGIVSFNIKGYKSDDIAMILDEDFNIAIRSGYHCTPLIHKYLKNEQYGGTARIGLGYFTTMSDIDKICEAIEKL